MPALSSLTAFDWLLVAVVALSTLSAFKRGIVKVLISFAGLVAGVLLAAWYYLPVSLGLARWIADPIAAQVAAFSGILLAVSIAAWLAAAIVRKGVATIGLGFLDRLLGAVFGLARGMLLCVAMLMMLAAWMPGTPWVQGSRLAPGFLAAAHAVSFVVPDGLAEKISTGTRHLLQKTPELFGQHSPGRPTHA